MSTPRHPQRPHWLGGSWRRLLAGSLVLAALVLGHPMQAPAAAAPGDDYLPLAQPKRLLDTRSGPIPATGSVTRVVVPGSPTAAMLNLTATDSRAGGYLTAWACGSPRPGTSNLNYAPAQTAVPGMALAKVGSGNAVCVYASAATHIVVDLLGTVPAGSLLRPIAPVRAIDTRAIGPRPSAGSVTRIRVAGLAGIGQSTDAVVANVTLANPASGGWAALYPCSVGWSGTSTINVNAAGEIRANAAITAVDDQGELCVRVSMASHVIVDLMARADAGSEVRGLRPQRVLDSRAPTSPTGGAAVAPGAIIRVPNIATGSYAVAVNLTVTGATGAGWARIWRCSEREPDTSTINFSGPGSVANATLVFAEPDGPLCVRVALASAHVVADATAAVSRDRESEPLGTRAAFGTWVPGMQQDPDVFDSRERLLRADLAIASGFYGYGDWFPAETERQLADGGRRAVLLSWDMGPFRFAEWSSGAHDDYLHIIGGLAAQFPYDVYLRPWAEMNGDWQPYQPTARGEKPAGGTPAQFIAAWRHVVDTVRDAGGSNIRWVFNPYAATYPSATDIRGLWPGRQYVDVLGMDGYNWGGGPAPWQSFAEVFAGIYSELTELDSDLPVWVCEVASREPSINDGAAVLPSRSKGDWVSDMFGQDAFSRIRAIAWFDERKERHWRFDSSPDALAAFRLGL